MIVKTRIFHTPKDGNSEDEYEDAYQPPADGEYELQAFTAAVADGASEGFLSRQWAELLVIEYCSDESDKSSLASFVIETEAIWREYLEAYIQKREEGNRPIQWYEEPGLENGAFSTLVGLSIFDGPNDAEKTWNAEAVGDTCLFQIRHNELVCSFPIENAETFNSWPALISSNPKHNKNLVENCKSAEGLWEDGDQFFMMSDAISAWFLQEHEANHQPVVWMQELSKKNNVEFVEWICGLRENNEIKNDDVTFMCISLSEC